MITTCGILLPNPVLDSLYYQLATIKLQRIISGSQLLIVCR